MSQEDFVTDLESIFSAVLAEARRNPSFAKALAASVVSGQSLKSSAKKRTSWEAEAPKVDFESLFQVQGEESVRNSLRGLPQREIYAWLRTSSLSARNASKMNKGQLIEHIVSSLKRRSGIAERRFDY